MQVNKMEMRKTQLGLEHGLVKVHGNSVLAKDAFKNMSEKNRKTMEDRKKKDTEVICLRYQHLKDQKNGKWEGWYSDYAGEPFRYFRFLHDNEYMCPRELGNKINSMCAPNREGLQGLDGNPLTEDSPMERTHQMIPGGSL